MLFIDGVASRLSSDLFQQTRQRFHDLRFGCHFQPSGSRCPSRIAPERMLFGWRNIALRSVGQFDIHRNRKWTAVLQLNARDAEDFIGNRRDAKVPNANRLQFEFRCGLFMQPQLFEGIHFRPTPRQPIADLRDQFVRPLEPSLIRSPPIQFQRFFRHRQCDVRSILNRLTSPHRTFRQSLDVSVQIIRLRRLAVVHPHAVAAGALRQNPDKPWLLIRHTDEFGKLQSKPTADVSGHQRRTVVMHRIVRQHGERLVICRMHR